MKLLLALLLVAGPLFAAADLEVVEIKSTVAADGAADLQIQVTNHGPDPAAAPRLRISLNDNAEERELSPLAVDETRTENLRITFSGLKATVLAEVYDIDQPDIRPSNNTAEGALQLPGNDFSDLEIMEATLLNAQPIKDKNLVIGLRLLNRGPRDSTNATISAELLLFQQAAGSAQKRTQKLQVGEQKEYRITIPLPQNYPATEGTVNVRWATAESGTQDPLMGNNTYALAIPLEARQPDLFAQNIRVDSRRELNFSVKNKGAARSKVSITALYLNGALVRRFETEEISPGGEKRLHYGASKVPTGTQVTVVTDYNADIEEMSEQNNRLVFTVTK